MRRVTQEDAFIASIIETPGDDTPRLIYADWLQEHGREERAEFVRKQCECPTSTLDYFRVRPDIPIHGFEKELPRWTRSSASPVLATVGIVPSWPWPVGTYRVRRGFVDEVILTGQSWLFHADAITSVVPLRKVVLAEWTANDALDAARRLFGNLLSSIRFVVGRTFKEVLCETWPKIEFELPDANRLVADIGRFTESPTGVVCA